MVIDVIHVHDLLSLEAKRNAPISRYLHSPVPSELPFQRMKTEPRQIHVGRLKACVQSGQDQAKPFRMLWLDPPNRSLREEPLQATVLEVADHRMSVTRYVTGVNS